MRPSDLAGSYQWNYRSQTPRRPDWFRQWPGGNRIAVTEKAAGERPLGYMSPGPRPSPYTLKLSASLGFKWNGDYGDSDVPYIIDVAGNRLWCPWVTCGLPIRITIS